MGVESALRKLVLAAASLLGVSFVAVSVPVVVLLGYRLLEIPMASVANVGVLAGLTLFVMASVILMILGCFLVVGGLQYYRGGAHQGVIFLGSLLASFYLLCLGVGSLLIVPRVDIGTMLLTVSPVLAMAAVATYMGRLTAFKLVGSILGIVGGVLLAVAVFYYQTLEVVFQVAFGSFHSGILFPGPFMSVAILEAIVLALGPVTGFIYFVLSGRREEPVAHAFLAIVALVYGVGTFIGSQILAFSFLNYLWKAPWVGPFHGVPTWIFNTVAFWSASLFLLMIAGLMLVLSSCVGFLFAAQEFAQL